MTKNNLPDVWNKALYSEGNGRIRWNSSNEKMYILKARKGCIPVCLDEAGRGVFDSVQKGRMRKSLFFINDRYEFFERLIKDINKLIKKCEKTNKKPCVRLNGTSDLTWEKIKHNGKTILEYFPQVQFYDYTKNPNRFENLPKNYDLTFSYTEKTPFSFTLISRFSLILYFLLFKTNPCK